MPKRRPKLEDDPLMYFNIKTDPTFPRNALLIVDKAKNILIILDAARMDKWGEVKADHLPG